MIYEWALYEIKTDHICSHPYDSARFNMLCAQDCNQSSPLSLADYYSGLPKESKPLILR